MSSARVGAPNVYPLGHPNRVKFVQSQPVAAEPDERAAAIFPPEPVGALEQEAVDTPAGDPGGEGVETTIEQEGPSAMSATDGPSSPIADPGAAGDAGAQNELADIRPATSVPEPDGQ
jgi:hypothetical protein